MRGIAGIVVLATLAASCGSAESACITEPIDLSERAQALRDRAIADFVRRDIIYKVVKTSASAVEIQITPRFLDLPFDTKQVLAWSVFSSNFDGTDDKQGMIFVDNRTLRQIARFDACGGLRLE